MKFFKKLDIPSPLTKHSLNLLVKDKMRYKKVYLDPVSFLSDSSKEFFDNLGVFPNIAILFGHVNDKSKNKNEPHIHTDIFLENGSWVKCPFAINFELTESVATIKWWDHGNLKEYYAPAEYRDLEYDYGNGIQYGEFRNTNTEQFSLLEECTLDSKNPVLIRTNIPHNVYYKEGYNSRLSLSLRFPLNQINSFEEAINIF